MRPMFNIKDMPKCLAGLELAGLRLLLALRTEIFNTEQIPLVEQVIINKNKSWKNPPKTTQNPPKTHIS